MIVRGTWLTDDVDYRRHRSAKWLEKGEIVAVLKIVSHCGSNRLRGQTSEGWISLRGLNEDANLVWAQKVPQEEASEPSERDGRQLEELTGQSMDACVAALYQTNGNKE